MNNKKKILENNPPQFVRTDDKTSVLFADGSWGLQNKIEQMWERIAVLSAMGMPHKDIAISEGISINELTKKYGDALFVGKTKADSIVMQTFYLLAISGKAPGTTALYLKNKLGWAEKMEHKTSTDDSERLKKMEQEVQAPDRLKAVKDIFDTYKISPSVN